MRHKRTSIDLLKEIIHQFIIDEAKPGGGITKIGALKIVNPSSATNEKIAALKSADGEVEDAAKKLDVSARSLYNYIEKEPKLQKAQDTAQDQAQLSKNEKKKK